MADEGKLPIVQPSFLQTCTSASATVSGMWNEFEDLERRILRNRADAQETCKMSRQTITQCEASIQASKKVKAEIGQVASEGGKLMAESRKLCKA